MARLKIEKLPVCSMARVVLHWTAGTYKASSLDQEHYHILIEGDGTIVYGKHDIDANAKPAREPRASHTRNCNTGSIGVSMCSMKDAKERPFSAGPFPMTIEQWKVAAEVVAELCRQYSIGVTPRTVLAHGEVQESLKIEQLQKWDPLVQPWAPSTPRAQVMDGFRALVKEQVSRLQSPAALSVPVVIGPGGFKLQSQKWKSKRAVLLVHGVGNAKPGDYGEVAQAIQAAAGEDCAVYALFYDIFNDWIGEKIQAKNLIGKLVGGMTQAEGTLPEGVSEFAGDVLWPMFSIGGRTAVRTAYIAQLHQMVIDGLESLKDREGHASTADLNMSIVCHSLGCFHTYEVLHTIATDPVQKLSPGTDGIKFNSVVFMASPVQLIRTLGERVASLLPAGLQSTRGDALSIPGETVLNEITKSVGRWVSVTGDLDPIGGHFLRKKADWAYMSVPGQEEPPIIDKQTLFGSERDESKLALLLTTALRQQGPPSLSRNNPHSWVGYIDRHKQELATWLA